jgi:DNA primase
VAVLPPEIIARVKDETDIVELVGRYVRLQPAGASYKGLCPFHDDKNPSLNVNPARQIYKCFSCQAGGDAISFLMEIENLTFVEAMETLARSLDIDLHEYLQPGEDEGEKRSYLRAHEAACDAFCAAWHDPRQGAAAREYLEGRGFSPEILDRHDVGWAPGGDWLAQALQRRGVAPDLALSAGLLRQNEGRPPFAYFRERIMFPIRNVARQVTGFGGRVLGSGEPKYLNSADSPFFSKSRLLYGFDTARMVIARSKVAIVVEGYLDVIGLAQAGVTNAVATCGTAFTPEQARLLRRGSQRVIVMFDGDAAGRKAAVKTCHVCLSNGLEAEIAPLPPGQDPADVALAGGADAVQSLLAERRPYLHFVRDAVARAGDERAAREKGVRQVLATIAEVPDAIRREYMLQEAAGLFELGVEVLRETLADMTRPGRRQPPATAPGDADDDHDDDGHGVARPQAPARTLPPHLRAVRRNTAVHAERVEQELLAQVLNDDAGAAGRLLMREAADLTWWHPAAVLLARELAAWDAAGSETAPRDWVRARWHDHDGAYRAYVTDLLARDIPEGGEIGRVVRDALERLRLARRVQQG